MEPDLTDSQRFGTFIFCSVFVLLNIFSLLYIVMYLCGDVNPFSLDIPIVIAVLPILADVIYAIIDFVIAKKIAMGDNADDE